MRRIWVAFLLVIILMMGGMEARADIFNGRSDQHLVLWFYLNGGAAWKAEIRVGPFEPQAVRIWSAEGSEPDPSPVVIQFLDAETGEELRRAEVRSQGEDFLVEIDARFRVRVTRPSELGAWHLRMEFLGHQPFVVEPLDVGLSWKTTLGFNRLIPGGYRWIMYGEAAEGVLAGAASNEGEWYGEGGLISPPECPCTWFAAGLKATGSDLERVYTARLIGYADIDVFTPTPAVTPTLTPTPIPSATLIPTVTQSPTTTLTPTPTWTSAPTATPTWTLTPTPSATPQVNRVCLPLIWR